MLTAKTAIDNAFSRFLNEMGALDFSTIVPQTVQSFVTDFLLNDKYVCEASMFVLSLLLEKWYTLLAPCTDDVINFLCSACESTNDKLVKAACQMFCLTANLFTKKIEILQVCFFFLIGIYIILTTFAFYYF